MNYSAKLVTHRQQPRIAVQFENKEELKSRFKKLTDARWSATLKCWHVPDTDENRKRFNLIKVLPYEKVEPLKKEVKVAPAKTEQKETEIAMQEKIQPYTQKLKDKALLKGYSENTIRNNISHFSEFLKVFINKKVV